jgi:hypothetical protein
MPFAILMTCVLGLAGPDASCAESPGRDGCLECQDVEAKMQAKMQEFRKLSHEISTINLLNGMRLTRSQTEQVLALARQTQALKTRLATENMQALDSALAAYEKFKAVANRRGEAPEGLVARVAVMSEHRVIRARHAATRRAEEELARLDEKLCEVLRPEQIQIVNTFKPCLIPPKDLRDPVRAGQAASDRTVKVLTKVRALPAETWARHRLVTADSFVKRVEGLRREITSDRVRDELRQWVVSRLEGVRAMSDTEFQMEKGAIAAEFDIDKHRKGLRVMSNKGKPDISSTARWLLSPAIVPILEERIRVADER